MQIPKKILNIWLKHYNYGDLDGMSAETTLNKSTISRVMNTSRCEQKTFDILSQYFIKKVQKDREKETEHLAQLEDDLN